MPGPVTQEIDQIFRREGSRVLATLIRLVGDFDLAEDAMQAAFVAAVEQWARDGIPGNPTSWLISTGRFKALDTIRRKNKIYATIDENADLRENETDPFSDFDESSIEDDRLRLIFTCCHPALPAKAQAALTLREVCGLTTEEIAHAYLCSSTTIGQRIVRAKAKIREERLPFEVPTASDLPARLRGVLTVVYLLFNEGYYSSFGESATRRVLSEEAIHLGRILVDLIPDPEVYGLLALMLLHESRRVARVTKNGDTILFDDQDKALWNKALFSEGMAAAARALDCAQPGSYALQAAIAGVHMEGAYAGEKDWSRIVDLYDRILSLSYSPIVELNRAVAIAMVDGAASGLEIVDRLLSSGELQDYALAHSTRADFCRRLDRLEEARSSYRRAIELTSQAPQRRFLSRRLEEVSKDVASG